MKKLHIVLLGLILIANVFMGVVIFRQNLQIEENNRKLAEAKVLLEDIDDAVFEQIIPILEEQ